MHYFFMIIPAAPKDYSAHGERREEIQEHTEAFMDGLQKNPNHVKGYFNHEKLKTYKE